LILFSLDKHTTPADFLSVQRARFADCSANTQLPQVFAVAFSHNASYLSEQPQQELLAFVWLAVSCDSASNPSISVSIFPATTEQLRAIEQLAAEPEAILAYCEAANLAHVRLDLPLLLEPIYIPKPWGQEIWYTGIEARGQAAVKCDRGSLPLPWVLEFLRPQLGLAATDNLILLKILDPLAEAPYGDLYFELHEQKQEVYVVTHVDATAWPGGKGAIQLGFNPAARANYATTDDFKAGYLHSVREYEQTRRAIDDLLDRKKQELGISLSEPVAFTQVKLWLKELSQHPDNKVLIDREQELKQAMDRFIALHPLEVGDVVAVPRLVPHALQHGVRVVEFQTPVYERRILSFGQKVLTQNHWDTEVALQLVDMDAEPFISPVQLAHTDSAQIQRIVNFDDFEVQRIVLKGDCQLSVSCYGLLMVLEGSVCIDDTLIASGNVALLPAQVTPQVLYSSSAVLLWAIPRSG
jgi:hypothetical protein